MGEKFNISNLNLYYGDFHALKDVDLTINEKEITAFIGPSGCGKSTFLKCLNRKGAEHPIEEVGKNLRGMMSWMKK